MRLSERALRKTALIYFRVISMRMKGVKDLDLKTRWFDDINDDDDMKVVNDMKDLGLKVLWFKRILIYLRRLRMSRVKELMIESEFNEKERWSNSEFKVFLLSYILDSTFDNIIMVALGNRMLNDSKFDAKVADWWFVIINLASAVMMMMLLWLYVVARLLSFMTRLC